MRWAAARTGLVHLVHVLHDGVPAAADVAGTVVLPSPELLADAAADAVARARELVDAVDPAAGVSVVTGHTVPLLVALSRSAHLLVLGDTRLRTAAGHVGEQVAVFLAVRARCPVVVVPGAARSSPGSTAPTPPAGPWTWRSCRLRAAGRS